jgi:fatty-acyl-CoA synthase
MTTQAAPDVAPELRVLEEVQRLARELGGARAAGAATSEASLERDLGFGSLERVELLSRLERVFGRRLDESFLRLDTARELAVALGAAPAAEADPGAVGAAVGAGRGPVAAATVHGSLLQHAERDPERPHVFMREEDGTEHTVTYGRLLDAASAVAGGLRARGLEAGDTVALMLPTGFDFLRAFQGILIAGAIPVPIYPPVRLDRLQEYAERQGGILADAGVKALVTIDRARPIAALLKSRVPSLRHVVSADELAETGLRWPASGGRGSDAAFIQYTSGSTGSPKGVLLTHDNLLANVKAIGLGMRCTPEEVGVSWLPLYHDMGLIGSWLFCMHHGYPLDVMSPLAFLSRPERWLWAVHRRRATLSPAPNFAYELCARKVPESALEGLDLSSWRCALNGAEPVQPETIDRFVARFGKAGFQRSTMFPVYGLAENSVAVTFPEPGRGPRILEVARQELETEQRVVPAPGSGFRFVSVGRALPDHEVHILDPAGQPLPEDHVGRIAFRGPSQMAGYFGKPEATAAITVADGFLDSGDLGFLHGGELYVAGRSKDLVIKGGRNLVPSEIEEAVAGVAGVRRGCVAAFGVPLAELGTEGLVVVAETRARGAEERARIEHDVVQQVVSAVGLPPDVVHLVPPGSVPKTSSGKVRRAACRELYLKGTLRQEGKAGGKPWRLLAAAAASELRGRLRPAGRALHAARVAGVTGALVPAVLAAAALTPSGAPLRRLGRRAARAILRGAGITWSRHGEPLPTRPVVLVANHASYVDTPLLLAALEQDFVFVAKSEVLGWPILGSLVRRTEQLTVDRFDANKGVADWQVTVEALRRGQSVLYFPEGTFTEVTGLRPFRLGAFQAALQAGVDVVPITLTGTRAVLRSGQSIPRAGHLTVTVGSPFPATGDDWAAAVRLRDRAADEIAARCGEPRLDLRSGGPERAA